MHLAAHKELALTLGVDDAIAPIDGGVYELANGQLTGLGRLTIGRVAIMGDGAGTIVPWDDSKAAAVLTAADRTRLDTYLDSERDRAERRASGADRRSRSSRQDAPPNGRARANPEQATPERAARPARKATSERGNTPGQSDRIAKGKRGRNRAKPQGEPPPVHGAQTRTFEVETRRARRLSREELREPSLSIDR